MGLLMDPYFNALIIQIIGFVTACFIVKIVRIKFIAYTTIISLAVLISIVGIFVNFSLFQGILFDLRVGGYHNVANSFVDGKPTYLQYLIVQGIAALLPYSLLLFIIKCKFK